MENFWLLRVVLHVVTTESEMVNTLKYTVINTLCILTLAWKGLEVFSTKHFISKIIIFKHTVFNLVTSMILLKSCENSLCDRIFVRLNWRLRQLLSNIASVIDKALVELCW